jgi:hypothetical protein
VRGLACDDQGEGPGPPGSTAPTRPTHLECGRKKPSTMRSGDSGMPRKKLTTSVVSPITLAWLRRSAGWRASTWAASWARTAASSASVRMRRSRPGAGGRVHGVCVLGGGSRGRRVRRRVRRVSWVTHTALAAAWPPSGGSHPCRPPPCRRAPGRGRGRERGLEAGRDATHISRGTGQRACRGRAPRRARPPPGASPRRR